MEICLLSFCENTLLNFFIIKVIYYLLNKAYIKLQKLSAIFCHLHGKNPGI